MSDPPADPVRVNAVRRALLPEFLTVEDLALALGRSIESARTLLQAGDIPAVKLRGRWLVARDTLKHALIVKGTVEVRRLDDRRAICFPRLRDEEAKAEYLAALNEAGGDRGAEGDILPLANVGGFAARLKACGFSLTVEHKPAGPGEVEL
jgi:hypothetical protein